MSTVGAFPLGSGSKDAALLADLSAGVYTAHVTNHSGTSGLALLEFYDADGASSPSASTARLTNISGRAHVGTGNDVLIAGFVLSGNRTKRLLIRAIGPGLKQHGVMDFLADPELQIFRGGALIASNDNWNSTDATLFPAIGAFALDNGSKDASLVLDLPPGVYTAITRGVSRTVGSALIEIYEMQ
jgi:hypothetical protein